MISNETLKREGKILLYCLLISFVFVIAVGFYSSTNERLAEKAKSEIDKAQAVSDSLSLIIGEKNGTRKDVNTLFVNFLRRKCNLMKDDYSYWSFQMDFRRRESAIEAKQREEKDRKSRWIYWVDFCDPTLYALSNTNLHLGYDFIANYNSGFGSEHKDVPTVSHLKAFLSAIERETNTTKEQARKNTLDNKIKSLSNDFSNHSNNILTREQRNEMGDRLFWGLLLVVYSTRGIKAFIAYGISQKKKIVTFLSVWSFVHFILYMFGGNPDYSGRAAFYPFTDYYGHYFDFHYYDITELIVYVGGAWLIFFLYYYLNEDKKA